MYKFERKNKEPIFIVLSKKIATTLKQDEMNETVNKLLEKVEEENPQDIETWTIKVEHYSIVGIFNKDDINALGDTLTILFQSEYDHPIIHI